MDKNELLNNMILELRRGVTTLAILMLLREEQYGYTLQTRLSEMGLVVEQGTLYPLLRRLETQGLLTSSWRVEEGRPRRYYVINQAGLDLVGQMDNEWQRLTEMIKQMHTQE